MTPPFSREQFFEVFSRYNDAVWPAQLLLYAAAVAALLVVLGRRPNAGRVASAVLALLWAWMGAVYHLAYFREVNPAATLFGAASLLAAALFAWHGVARGRLEFAWALNARAGAGLLLVAYSLAIYPVLAWLLGHRYPDLGLLAAGAAGAWLLFGRKMSWRHA
jgi:hypothetical protein